MKVCILKTAIIHIKVMTQVTTNNTRKAVSALRSPGKYLNSYPMKLEELKNLSDKKIMINPTGQHPMNG